MIRYAEPRDVPGIVGLVKELATYERAPEHVELTEDLLDAALFGRGAAAYCHVVEVDGALVGMALWFVSFSTWVGRPGIYLEDLFVVPEHRRNGYGRALLATLAGIVTERGYGRLEWAVLDWNTPAIEFYRSLGAVPMEEWTVWRLSGEPLAAFGSG
jgi:GNAT superfamily N-acetyltransferase